MPAVEPLETSASSGRPLRSRARLSGFLLRLAIAFILLAVPWPGLDDHYASAFRGVAGVVFGSFGGDGVVRFEPCPPSGGTTFTTRVRLWNRRQLEAAYRDGTAGDVRTAFGSISTRRLGWLPSIFTVALIVATPLPWKRRLRALVWGLMLIHACVAFTLDMELRRFLDMHAQHLQFAAAGSFGRWVIAGMHDIFVVGIVAPMLMGIIVWVLATFRSGDMALLLPPSPVVPRRSEPPASRPTVP